MSYCSFRPALRLGCNTEGLPMTGFIGISVMQKTQSMHKLSAPLPFVQVFTHVRKKHGNGEEDRTRSLML